MTCSDTHEWVCIGRMWKQFERDKQAGSHQKWLGNRCVSDGFGVGFGAVTPQINARDS